MTATEEELADHRDAFVAYLRKQLFGPADGEDETLVDPPDRRYLMGTLYPRGTDLHVHSSAAGEQEDSDGAIGLGEEDGFADDPVAEANAWLPSSMGFSFFTDAPRIDLVCSAARYETSREGRRRVWRRLPRQADAVSVTPESARGTSVLDGHATLYTRWRRHRNGHLVTCVLANAHREEEEPRDSWSLMLFQAELSARTIGGEVLEYPSTRLNSRDPEEQELRIQYRHVVTRAIGHGCAVEWDDTHKPVTSLSADVLPQKAVPHIRPDGPADLPVLKLATLSQPDLSVEELHDGLASFVAGYRAWYENLDIERSKLHNWARPPAARILDRIRTAVERMEAGVRALTSDTSAGEDAREAFRLANRAMALQMLHSHRDLAGARRRRNEDVVQVAEPDGDAAWHPFQLAFFLLVVEGLMNPNSEDRDIVDLIWFPTGGGKTEAYLLTACFEIGWRRLHHGVSGGGTAVISRYTLSLLTTQQFQRTATAICALEYMRRGHDGDEGRRLGSEPITIGLWVGQETTPNSYARAAVELGELKQLTEPDDRFLLERCPWCGTEIVPRRYTRDSDYGISADHSSFAFNCPRETCFFHDELPVAVVDQHIYECPPTFLLGTVDKFARLAWEPKAGRIFGGRGRMRPSLVIQDELHLLAGPLGTTVGLYESAVLELCAWEGDRPKVIASTATIRRSQEQIQNLYGRSTQLFPPAGLDARNSYFASTDETRPGRLYVGVMAQGHTPATATVHTGAATLQAPKAVTDRDDLRDAYWTVVAYHNSLRELGRTITIARDDIPARLAHLTRHEASRRDLPDSTVVELTSNISRTNQPKLLDRLGRPLTDKESISFLATTNMLSVGVDVPRLGLMIMNGQPKTTSEYIQATSRVGRRLVPGLIVTLFRSSKPRDRSHYESFGPYHASLYRHVEPTSVTPWSPPSRQRALHAVLTILVRHGLGLTSEDKAGDVLGRRADLELIRDRILRHIHNSDPGEAEAAETDLNDLIDGWLQAAESARGNGGRLYYKPHGRGDDALLTDFGRPAEGLWETAQSMRNVDRDCLIAVRGA